MYKIGTVLLRKLGSTIEQILPVLIANRNAVNPSDLAEHAENKKGSKYE